jgi:hypothetical protein
LKEAEIVIGQDTTAELVTMGTRVPVPKPVNLIFLHLPSTVAAI